VYRTSAPPGITSAINPFDSVAPASAAAASHIQYRRARGWVASRCAITSALNASARKNDSPESSVTICAMTTCQTVAASTSPAYAASVVPPSA
jgi:hypothetical protein